MKQSKYYTPSIEEFYVGFECEFKNSMQSNTWKKEICDQDTISIIYDTYEHEDYEDEFADTFRVKYLDKEDIESLDWEYTGQKDDYGFLLFTKNIKAGFNSGNLLTLRYSPINRGIWIKRKNYGSWGDNVDELPFSIKNKSELKKLMQQLNINE